MTTALAPAPHDQRMAALAKAQEVRLAAYAIREDIRVMSQPDAREAVARLLDDPPEEIAASKVAWLLLSIPYLGRTKMNRMLRRFDLGHIIDYRVGPCESKNARVQLTERQRRLIAAALRSL